MGSSPPPTGLQGPLTPDNHGALVTLLTFIWLVLMGLVVIVQSAIFLLYEKSRNIAYVLIWTATV